ncbi:MAG: hypothetical protein IT342_07220 [Candidatus Melainabacteria bacterium]|nr:hypothetical protein [Candidatus Melainabacteria bacterium]
MFKLEYELIPPAGKPCMLDSFSPNLITVISFAQEEAVALEHYSVDPEHLLAGLLRLTDDCGAAVLLRRGASLESVINEIKNESTKATKLESTTDSLSLSASAKLILESAYEAAMKMNCRECGTQHLILALMKYDPTAQILANCCGASISGIESEARSLCVSLPPLDDIQLLKKQVSTWQSRAEMARDQGNDELFRQAIEQKSKYEKLLADHV